MVEPLAIHGGPKTVEKQFPWPIFDESDVAAVAEIVRSGQWGDPDCGGEVHRLEKEFADFTGARHALAVVNGSVALRVALLASGVQPGDEVIVPPYTFYATASIVLEANCVPVFADIDPETYCIDPDRIEEALTPKTRAIIPVHFGGQSCDMDRIMAIAEKHGLAVIEDACHGHGAEYKGVKLGSIGQAGCFSFQSSKNLTSGEGGMIVTNDDSRFARMNSLRNCGRVEGGMWYDHVNLGCNYRLTPIQAALVRRQLTRLDAQTRKRNENGLLLNDLLSRIDGIAPLSRGHGETLHSYHLYIFRYDSTQFGGLPKIEFVEQLVAEGVPSFIGYPKPLYRQPFFLERNVFAYPFPEEVDYSRVRCPVCEMACAEEAVWIFQQALLGEKEDMESFGRAIQKIQTHARAAVPPPR